MSEGVFDTVAVIDDHRAELIGYCYRMLASAAEAEDAVQETVLRAWRGYDRFEGRVPLRSWLFRIATNVCLTTLAGRQRRAVPMDLGPARSGEAGPGPAALDQQWVEPIADRLMVPVAIDAAEVAIGRHSIRLAFIAALQRLPPPQRAVLILRDVLRWEAAEVASLLDTTVPAVKSSLQRARATMAAQPPNAATAPELDEVQQVLLADYVDAFERYDIERLVALLHDDATLSMPPHHLWLRGASTIAAWWRQEGAACRGSTLIATSANGAPAFGQYRPRPGLSTCDAFAIKVIDVSGDRIRGIDCFIDTKLFAGFGLPLQIERHRR